MTRHSRQRDAVYENLCSRFDHPTAEDIYLSLKKEIPDISLATVYRNLALLENEGKIARISCDGTARYDANFSLHAHFVCKICGRVTDIESSGQNLIAEYSEKFEGTIMSQSLIFGGICPECKKIK
ncbi:MAG: transcriptional repressor [Clostridia bacterium]|nr:transcriptional repressor [Clostridia bacterium]